MNISETSSKYSKLRPFIALACIIANHAYMHMCVASDVSLNLMWAYRALTFLLFDVLFILLMFRIIVGSSRCRLALCLTWFFWLVIDLGNIVYSRFFYQYLTLGSLSEASNLNGLWWTQYISSAIHFSDIFLLFTSICFFCALRSKNNIWNNSFSWRKCLCALIVIVLPHTLMSDAMRLYKHTFPETLNMYLSDTQGQEFHRKSVLEQSLYFCSYGLVRTQLSFALFYPSTSRSLTSTEINEINEYVRDHHTSLLPINKESFHLPTDYNISFLIVESYMSHVSDLRICGMEVTPNLNRLKRTEGTYFNAHMRCNRELGESSDAQLIYFTGLLPLIGDITVSELATKTIPSLPALLTEQYGFTTHMTIPTKPHVWHQSEVNHVYGIQGLTSSVQSTNRFLDDDASLFQRAIADEQTMRQPFFHVILTASMHSPYDLRNPYLNDVPLRFPSDYTEEYCNYLRACWYTDKCIGQYINSLKQRGLYDKTVLIITADHESHPELLRMSANQLSDCYLPLFIIGAHISANDVRNGEIEQADLFPSLIDLFSIDSEWKGLGHSIFRPMGDNSQPNKAQRSHISDVIIRGNWFKSR